MLELYRLRTLTKSLDNLPVVAGITRAIEEQTYDKYFVGLWRLQLIEYFLWQPSRGVKVPTEYRAPSWSWTPIDGGLGCAGPSKLECMSNIAVVGCHLELKGKTPYGEIKSA